MRNLTSTWMHGAIDWSSDIDTALASVPLTLEMTGTFSQPYNGNGYILIGAAATTGGSSYPQQSSHNDCLHKVRLGGTLAQWQNRIVECQGNLEQSPDRTLFRHQPANGNDHSIRLSCRKAAIAQVRSMRAHNATVACIRKTTSGGVQLGDNTEEPCKAAQPANSACGMTVFA